MFLFLDLETSGLVDTTKVLEDPTQPWPVQVAAKLVREDRSVHSFLNLRIKAEGRAIAAGATAVHGITSREADRSGVGEIIAIAALLGLAGDAHAVVGFGLSFDTRVIEGAVLRLKRNPRKWIRPGLQKIDLLVPAANAAQLPTEHESNTYRWPKLTTAAAILLGENPNMAGAHDAWTDMERAERVFFHLKDQGMLELHGGEIRDTDDGVSAVGAGAQAAARA